MDPRILLIADHHADTDSLERILQDNDIFVHCGQVTESDIKQLLLEKRINLILLDESCFSMLGFLNSIVKETGIILLLHHQDEDTIRTSMNYNVKGFLFKPRYYDLIPTIHRALKIG
ncbi:response regulator [Thalassobacillus pellis]|uniref:response regulator n=1 Tax=Thalassobacillus pellis TaxID=748008 RepID=UPI0019608D8E|nr:response regulator [Thalassobacillus pellis]MBM7553809.1 DNA-binding NarL/FixJ family response regulator [Thalassobacillus pellis]